MSKRLKLLIMITFLALFAIIIFKAFDEKANGDLSGLEILEPLESRKTIVVGDDIDYPPYSYVDESGRPQGFNLELIQAAADAVGYNVEFRLDEWSNVRESLENGEIDAISGMFFSSERQMLYSFSTRHSVSFGDIFAPHGVKLDNLDELRGKTVVVQDGDIVHEYLKKLDIGIDIIPVPTVSEALNLVSKGTYDYAGVLKIPGQYIIKKEGIKNLEAKGFVIEPSDYCMAVAKENEEILYILNSGLYVLKSTGIYDEIYDKWLGVYDEKSTADFIRENLWIILASIICLSALIGWNITLNKMVRIKTEALIRSNENRKRIFDTSIIPIIVMDAGTYHFIDCNQAAIQIYGYSSKEEVLGKTPLDVSAPIQYDGDDSEKKAIEYINFAIETGAVVFEWRHQRENGELWDAEVHLLSFKTDDKQMMQFSLVDITNRKRAEEELKREKDNVKNLNETLEQKVKDRTEELVKMEISLIKSEKMAALGTLVAGVSHEINTPLGIGVTAISHIQDSIREFENKYKSGQLDRKSFEVFLENISETGTIIMNNLNRANRLMQSFKQVSVDQSNEIKRKFKVKEYIEELLISLNPKIKRTKQSIVIKCDDSLEIDSYPGAISQILTNLIMNSLMHAYIPEDIGEITISFYANEKYLKMKYEDDGRGISQDILDRILEPFFTTKRDSGGTGLGLHIVYNIVTLQLNGTISCESKVDSGTTFTIEIPLDEI